VINTWHGGGAYKRVGCKDRNTDAFQKYSLKMTNKKYLSWFISSGKRFTEVISDSFFIPREKFVPAGMPRNDIFFHDYELIRNRTRERLSISRETGILLYAPTYRKYSEKGLMNCLDVQAALGALSNRFNKTFVCFIRGHHCMSEVPNIANVVDVTAYPDMQELLCAVDVLITDYSSSIWDFSFTKNPCFIYAPDLKKFKMDQSFYTPIEEWPFIVAETNGELLRNISKFDMEKHLKAIGKHHADLGNYDNGTASKTVCKIIDLSLSI
jgi:CDP-glycerol glycerophosphotransferase